MICELDPVALTVVTAPAAASAASAGESKHLVSTVEDFFHVRTTAGR